MVFLYAIMAAFLIVPFLVLQAMPSYRWLAACAVLVAVPILNELYYDFIIPVELRHEGNGFAHAFGNAAAYLYSIFYVVGLITKAIVLFLRGKGEALSTRLFAGCCGFLVLSSVPAVHMAAEQILKSRMSH